MSLLVRDATLGDLDEVIALTRHRRHQLAQWQPTYWRAAQGADDLHRFWLQYLIESDQTTRVVAEQNQVHGFAVCIDQGSQWFIDDLAVRPSRWPDAGTALLSSIHQRPALICNPALDRDAKLAAEASGYEWVSSYWLQPAGHTHPNTDALEVSQRTLQECGDAPPHTAKTANPSAFAFECWEGGDGWVTATPSTAAPPVYDPGGSTCVVDRVNGTDRSALLRAAVRTAFDRGDVQVLVVCSASDAELVESLTDSGWRHIIDIGRLDDSARDRS